MGSWKCHKSARVLMRSVSLFIASSRRISAASKHPTVGKDHDLLSADDSSSSKGVAVRMDELSQNVSKITGIRSHKSPVVNLIDTLKKQTHFTKDELERLICMFRKLVIPNDSKYTNVTTLKTIPQNWSGNSAEKGMDRVIFRELLHNTFCIVTEDILMDRIFSAFDRLSDGIIHLDEWILGLSIFLKGTLEEKIAFSFFVYDLNSDGFISKEEIFSLLRNSLMKMPQDEDPDENVRDLAEIVLKKLDSDRDNKISFQDYRRAILRDGLLLEALGQCLPTEDAVNNFFATLKSK